MILVQDVTVGTTKVEVVGLAPSSQKLLVNMTAHAVHFLAPPSIDMIHLKDTPVSNPTSHAAPAQQSSYPLVAFVGQASVLYKAGFSVSLVERLRTTTLGTVAVSFLIWCKLLATHRALPGRLLGVQDSVLASCVGATGTPLRAEQLPLLPSKPLRTSTASQLFHA
jgi:hypothetical protein